MEGFDEKPRKESSEIFDKGLGNKATYGGVEEELLRFEFSNTLNSLKFAPLSQTQHSYLKAAMDSWLNVAEGGKRGGKNVVNTLAFALLLETHPDKLHFAGGVSSSAARINIIDCNGLGLLYYYRGRCKEGYYKGRQALFLETKTGPKVVLTAGGGRDGDRRYIKGFSFGMAYITEVNECHPSFISEVFDRTLASKDRRIFHDLNPKSARHFYYRDFLTFHEERQKESSNYGFNYGHFTIFDNLSLSSETVKAVCQTYDKTSVWYQRDILGKRIQASGLVYDMFCYTNCVVKEAPKACSKFYVACDYGTQNPTVFGLWGLSDGIWYLLSEYRFSGREESRQKTDREFCDDYFAFTRGYHISAVIVDPSAASFIAELSSRGVPVKRAKNEVLSGIRLTGSLLKEGRIKIVDGCRWTIEEFESYSWDYNKAEAGFDVPLKENDHFMDSVRYFCMEVLGGKMARVVGWFEAM